MTVYVSLMAELPNRSTIPLFFYYFLEKKAIHIFLDCVLLFSDGGRGTQMERKKKGHKEVFLAFIVRI